MTPARTSPLARASAFTVVEMLVVVSIVVILIAIAVPGFQAMMKGSEETLADNQIKAAMRAARDVAIRSGPGADAAAVFFFTDEGRTRVVPYVRAGIIRDRLADNSEVEREIFVPALGVQSLELPKNWTVRGYVPPGYIEDSVSEGWYSSQGIGDGSLRYDAAVGNWVFPETNFFDPDDVDAGPERNTFIVRFAGGTGHVLTSNADAVLLLAPAMTPTAESRISGAPANLADWRRRLGEDPAGYVQKILKTKMTLGPSGAPSAATLNQLGDLRRRLLGRISTDMIMARPVTQVAMLDETRLAADIGVPLPRPLGALLEDNNNGPTFLRDVTAERINHWIEGDTNDDRIYGDAEDRVESKIFVFDRYTGSLRRAEVQREQVP